MGFYTVDSLFTIMIIIGKLLFIFVAIFCIGYTLYKLTKEGTSDKDKKIKSVRNIDNNLLNNKNFKRELAYFKVGEAIVKYIIGITIYDLDMSLVNGLSPFSSNINDYADLKHVQDIITISYAGFLGEFVGNNSDIDAISFLSSGHIRNSTLLAKQLARLNYYTKESNIKPALKYDNEILFDNETNSKLKSCSLEILNSNYERAYNILNKYKHELNVLSERLLTLSHLSVKEIIVAIDNHNKEEFEGCDNV